MHAKKNTAGKKSTVPVDEVMPTRANVILIRLAEKAKSGHSPAGHTRADAYVEYLQRGGGLF